MFKIIFLSVLLFSFYNTLCAEYEMMWTNWYDYKGADNSFDIALDNTGNIYIAGTSYNPAPWQYVIFKYNQSGNRLWTTFLNSGLIGYAKGITVDNWNNAYITGSINRTDIDYCLIKLDPNGTIVWSNYYDAGNYDEANDIVIDSSNYLYITGQAERSTYDFCTIKYSTNGQALWTNYYDRGEDDQAFGITLDSAGFVYVAGISEQGGANDACVIKYNVNGDGIWTNVFNIGGDDELYDIKFDTSDNIYIAGSCVNGTRDYCVIKFNSTGTPIWTNFFNSTNNEDEWAVGLDLDSEENVYVIGHQNGISTGKEPTIKYTADGQAVWTNYWGGQDERGAQSIIINKNIYPNRIYIASTYTRTDNDYLIYGLPPQKGPVNLSGQAVSDTAIKWTWSYDSNMESGFEIQDNTHNIIGTVGADTYSWTEDGLLPDTTYQRVCVAVNFAGKSDDSNLCSVTTLPIPKEEEIKTKTSFIAGPTSFNPNTDENMKIYLSEEKPSVSINIYTISGDLVKTWDVSGQSYAEWDGKNSLGDMVRSGIYLIHIKGDNIEKKIKMMIIK